MKIKVFTRLRHWPWATRVGGFILSLLVHLVVLLAFVTTRFTVKIHQQIRPVINVLAITPEDRIALRPPPQMTMAPSRSRSDTFAAQAAGAIDAQSGSRHPQPAVSGQSTTQDGNGFGQGKTSGLPLVFSTTAGANIGRPGGNTSLLDYLRPEKLAEVTRKVLPFAPGSAGFGRPGQSDSGGPGVTSPALAGNRTIVFEPRSQAYFLPRGVDVSSWAERAVRAILHNWLLFPDNQTSRGGEAGIEVAYGPDGRPVTTEITRSSGIPAIDQAALNSLRLSAGAVKLPHEFAQTPRRAFFLFRLTTPNLNPLANVSQPQPAETRDDAIVQRVGLVLNEAFRSTELPGRLALGIDMKIPAYFKLLREDNDVIAAGQLLPGDNRVMLSTDGFFQRSGIHSYWLELFENGRRWQRHIQLDLKIEKKVDSGQLDDEIRRSGYGVAIFMEARLLAYDRRPLPVRHDSLIEADRIRSGPPSYQDADEKQLQRAELPVLAIPFLAYKYLVKPQLEKSKSAPTIYFRQLQAVYRFPDAEKGSQPMEVVYLVQSSF